MFLQSRVLSDTHGLHAQAFDRDPPDAQLSNQYFDRQFFPVQRGGPEVLAGHAQRALLLVWPFNMNHDGGEAWDCDALEIFLASGGEMVIHVGHLDKPPVNTSNPFRRLLEARFKKQLHVPTAGEDVVHWPPNSSEALTVWKRK